MKLHNTETSEGYDVHDYFYALNINVSTSSPLIVAVVTNTIVISITVTIVIITIIITLIIFPPIVVVVYVEHTKRFPEKVPFRLTRMLVNAMEVSGVEGNYRKTCENVMGVLRDNRDSLLAMLQVTTLCVK